MTDYRAEMAKGMSEKHLMENIIQTAKTFGWKTYHTHDSRRSEPGFPDLIMVRGEEMLCIECKTMKNYKPSAAQMDWLLALGNVRRVGVGVWRPDAWILGCIEERLRGEDGQDAVVG